MVRHLWAFLSDTSLTGTQLDNLKLLGIIIVAIATAGWTVYTHFDKKREQKGTSPLSDEVHTESDVAPLKRLGEQIKETSEIGLNRDGYWLYDGKEDKFGNRLTCIVKIEFTISARNHGVTLFGVRISRMITGISGTPLSASLKQVRVHEKVSTGNPLIYSESLPLIGFTTLIQPIRIEKHNVRHFVSRWEFNNPWAGDNAELEPGEVEIVFDLLADNQSQRENRCFRFRIDGESIVEIETISPPPRLSDAQILAGKEALVLTNAEYIALAKIPEHRRYLILRGRGIVSGSDSFEKREKQDYKLVHAAWEKLSSNADRLGKECFESPYYRSEFD